MRFFSARRRSFRPRKRMRPWPWDSHSIPAMSVWSSAALAMVRRLAAIRCTPRRSLLKGSGTRVPSTIVGTMASASFGTMALGGEMNGGGRGPRASNGVIGGSTALGAMNGAAIERHALNDARGKIDSDAQIFRQFAPEQRPHVPVREDGRDPVAHHIRFASRQADDIALEIFHVEFLGFPRGNIKRANSLPSRESGAHCGGEQG